MQELSIFKFNNNLPELQKIDQNIADVKKGKHEKAFIFSSLLFVFCVFGLLQQNVTLSVVSACIGFGDLFLIYYFGIFTLARFSAKRYLSHPKDDYQKYCFQLYQLIMIINQQITRYNISLRSAVNSSNGRVVDDEVLESIYQKLKRKIERIWAILNSLEDIKTMFNGQESKALIAELSHLAISEVDQANPLLMGPIDSESLQEEIHREQEVLESFCELEQNR